VAEPKIIVFILDTSAVAARRCRKAARRMVVLWGFVAVLALVAMIAIIDRYLIIR